MGVLSAVLFSLAVSIDGFGVGLAYGLRRIKISLIPLLVICLTSAVAITVSMFFGSLVAFLFAPAVAVRVGALLLMLVGFWIILEAWSKANGKGKASEDFSLLLRIKVPVLGIVIQILKEPQEADFDKSGTISSKEALILGLALAMDAFGAGFGAAVAGFQLALIPFLVGAFKFVLLTMGLWLGRRNTFQKMGLLGSLLPGVILIILGVLQL